MILIKKKKFTKFKNSIFFGLGWGIGEAIIIYLPAILTLPIYSFVVPTIGQVLPGAIERNLAIILHIALTIIIVNAVTKKKKYLYLAILLHIIVNYLSYLALVVTQNSWFTVLVIGIQVLAVVLISFYVNKGFIRSKVKTVKKKVTKKSK